MPVKPALVVSFPKYKERHERVNGHFNENIIQIREGTTVSLSGNCSLSFVFLNHCCFEYSLPLSLLWVFWVVSIRLLLSVLLSLQLDLFANPVYLFRVSNIFQTCRFLIADVCSLFLILTRWNSAAGVSYTLFLSISLFSSLIPYLGFPRYDPMVHGGLHMRFK